MNEILRITDRFKITGRGTVYTVKIGKGIVINIGDIFFDLRGNKFEVSGIEMFRRTVLEETSLEDMPCGLMFRLLDGVEISGDILVRNLYDINFLFCNHPLYQRKVDEDYKKEYQEAGLHHPCALFSYEDLERDELSLFGESISGLTIYRGWMMKPEVYSTFYTLLEAKGIILINTPEEYERYHTLPGWYEDFFGETIQSIWESEGKPENLLTKAKQLSGSYIVKDYVKSRKHEWYDACFIKDISDENNASKIIYNFVERQGEALTGGLVLREFIKLKQLGFHEQSGMPISEEYRVFVFAGKVLIIDNYWTEKENVQLSENEIRWIEDIARRIKSNFATVDIARKEDGTLIIMEFGDGQVSGLQQIDAGDFYHAFEYKDEIPIEEFFPEGAVVLAADPLPDKTVNQMRTDLDDISSTQELVDAYIQVHNKFWFVEDDLYDYEKDSDEYVKIKDNVEAWGEIMDSLDSRIMEAALQEGLLVPCPPNSGTVKQLEAFMKKYGYRDGHGWWVKLE